MERDYSRCQTCGKRMAWLGPPQPRPCLEGAASAAECRDVLDALVRARQITLATGKTFHAETEALMQAAGYGVDRVDTEIAMRQQIAADDRMFRYDMRAKDALADWINNDQSRALIVAKWAIDQIDITDNGTRNMLQIGEAADKIAREVKEHAEALAAQDFEIQE